MLIGIMTLTLAVVLGLIYVKDDLPLQLLIVGVYTVAVEPTTAVLTISLIAMGGYIIIRITINRVVKYAKQRLIQKFQRKNE